jgi:aminoglycoside phosphotransferase (APT) family kinase protein
VATGPIRAEGELTEGLARWMAEHPDLVPGARPGQAPPRIRSLSHAEAGMANETVLVDLDGDHPGIVLRLPPIEPTFEGYDLSLQVGVQNAVASAGIPAPAPAVLVDDPRWIGTPFMVMPMVDGYIPGPAPLFDPSITGTTREAQRRLHDGLIDTLVALHAVDWEAAGLGTLLRAPDLGGALDFWERYVEWAGEGSPLPALTEALWWCRRHRPAATAAAGGAAPVLLWGDARLGNLVFDDESRVHAVLDWDLASLGPREMDLGWHFGLTFMMEQLFGDSVPGFPSRGEVIQRYEEGAQCEVRDLAWHEVFALVRALAINDRHQRIAASVRRAERGESAGGAGGGGSGPSRPRDNPMAQVLLDRMAAEGKG